MGGYQPEALTGGLNLWNTYDFSYIRWQYINVLSNVPSLEQGNIYYFVSKKLPTHTCTCKHTHACTCTHTHTHTEPFGTIPFHFSLITHSVYQCMSPMSYRFVCNLFVDDDGLSKDGLSKYAKRNGSYPSESDFNRQVKTLSDCLAYIM